MAQGKATIDHDTIKQWVEERGGCPAHVKGSGSNDDPGILRIDFPGFSGGKSLEPISWDRFFEAFDSNALAFLYQEDKDSRFSKLISRDNAELTDSSGTRGDSNSKAGKNAGANKRDGSSRRTASKAGNGGSSKATGKGTGSVDALTLLEQQHREVEELFEKLESAKGGSQKERMFSKLADALAAHSRIEETIFYPCMFNDETESELREAVEEHLVAKRLIADLLEMKASHPQFMSKVLVLKEVVKQHVDEEEQELFAMVRRQDTEDLEVLGRKMQQRYKELMKAEPRSEVPKETRSAAIQF